MSESEFDVEEMYPLIEEVLGDDPGLDEYQEFKCYNHEASRDGR